jgi:hypothetical protein
LIERSGNRLANEPALGKSAGINWNLRDNNGINLFHDLRVCGKPDIRRTFTPLPIRSNAMFSASLVAFRGGPEVRSVCRTAAAIEVKPTPLPTAPATLIPSLKKSLLCIESFRALPASLVDSSLYQRSMAIALPAVPAGAVRTSGEIFR